MNAGLIGLVAVGLVVVCIVGLALLRRRRPSTGKHAEQPHEGYADSEQRLAELRRLGVDPMVSLLHRNDCVRLLEHVAPVPFDVDESEWAGSHGESNHPDAVAGQCMCGHPNYVDCPDWLGGWEPSAACEQGRHGDCTNAGCHTESDRLVFGTCPCDCHAVPLSAAIKRYRAELNEVVRDWRRDRRDWFGG